MKHFFFRVLFVILSHFANSMNESNKLGKSMVWLNTLSLILITRQAWISFQNLKLPGVLRWVLIPIFPFTVR